MGVNIKCHRVARRRGEAHMSSQANEEAASAIRAHHRELHEDLRTRVAALSVAVRSGADHIDARDAVIEYLDRDLLPHAAAEETALYPAGDAGVTAMLVRAMRNEHRDIVGRVGDLRTAADPVDAVAGASALLALFESHLAKENDLLLPVLTDSPAVSLHDLLGEMHELVG
jgi:iron-sulfur cluster repair protein YtfE (RIC family)